MPVSNAMKTHAAGGTTNLCTLWKVREAPREEKINWTNQENVRVISHNLIKTEGAGGIGSWDAGASSVQIITADGYVEAGFHNYGRCIIGLSTTDTNTDYSTINFAMHVSTEGFVPNFILIYEDGGLVHQNNGPYQANDSLKIQVEDNVVTYWWNDTLLYTSENTPTLPLVADASIATLGSTIDNAVIANYIPETFYFTNHTRNITYGGQIYQAVPLRPTQVQTKTGLGPDNAEITAVLAAGVFEEADLLAGRWNLAQVEMLTVNYLDPSMGYLRRVKGYLGEVQVRNSHFTAELRGMATKLGNELGDLASPLCRVVRLGDNVCKVDLVPFTHHATVTDVTSNEVFETDEVQADSYFRYGRLRFTSGANAGWEMEIKDNTGAELTLVKGMPYAIQAGDNVTLIAGCDRTRTQCRDKFDNVVNIDGEPDVPGLDHVYKWPE